MAKTTELKLSEYGYSMQEANEYVLAMVNMAQAQALAGKVASLGIDAQDLANIVHVQKQEVVDYFHYQGVDTNLLNAGATGMSLTNASGGDVYLYDPNTGKSRLVVKFGTQIGDIAVDTNGDIYGVGVLGSKIYRYDFSEGKIVTLDHSAGSDVYSLGFFGDTLVSGMKDSLSLFDKHTGETLAQMTVPVVGPPAGADSDLLFISDKLYRNSAGGLTETDVNTGEYKEITKVFNFFTVGLVNGGDGWIIGYADHLKENAVTAFNVNTHEVKSLVPWHESPVGQDIWGATEALQMHVDLWGMGMA